MVDEQVAIFTPVKICKLVIRQPVLDGYIGKVFAIKFLYAVGETYPTKIVLIKSHISHSALQQSLIYTIAERIEPLNGLSLCVHGNGNSKNTAYQQLFNPQWRLFYFSQNTISGLNFPVIQMDYTCPSHKRVHFR